MPSPPARSWFASALVFTALVSGCGESTYEIPVSLRDFIMGLEDLPEPESTPPTLVDSSETKEVIDDSVQDCSYERYQGIALHESLVSFDPNADTLWPGAIVQSETLEHGLLSPVALPRAASAVTLTNAALDGSDSPAEVSYSRDIEDPSLSSVQDAIAEILAQGDVHVAAKTSYLAEEAHSLNEAALKAGLSADWLTGSASAEFSGSWSEARSTFVVRFVQAYYTVSAAAPSSPEAVFAPSVTVEDAMPYMGDGNPPGYISSVTYGRMLLLKVESSHSAEELKAALDAALQIGVVGVDADVSFEHKEVLDESSFSALALGGDPATVVDLMAPATDRVEALRAYFANGATYSPSSPGVPISYSVRRLSDNRTIKVGSSIDYDIPNCTVASDVLTVRIDRLVVVADGDSLGQGEIGYQVYIDDMLKHEDSVQAASGDVVQIGKEIFVSKPETHLEELAIKVILTENNNVITSTSTHTFLLDEAAVGGAWSGSGVATTTGGVDGNLEVNVVYTLEP